VCVLPVTYTAPRTAQSASPRRDHQVPVRPTAAHAVHLSLDRSCRVRTALRAAAQRSALSTRWRDECPWLPARPDAAMPTGAQPAGTVNLVKSGRMPSRICVLQTLFGRHAHTQSVTLEILHQPCSAALWALRGSYNTEHACRFVAHHNDGIRITHTPATVPCVLCAPTHIMVPLRPTYRRIE
jgi:hypothetical protein